jgi:hypothetical protein
MKSKIINNHNKSRRTLFELDNNLIRQTLEKKAGVYKFTTQNSEQYSFQDHQYAYVFENDTLYGRA